MARPMYRSMLILASLLMQGDLIADPQPAPPGPPAAPPAARTRGYEARRASGALKMDGILDETAWQHAQPISFMTFKDHQAPSSHTEARLLWDDEYLYVGFEAADKDIWSYMEDRDDWTSLEDCLEIFFKTDPDEAPYYNMEINARGTIFDAFSPKPRFGGGYRRFSRWDCEGLIVKTHVRGTLNDPTDVDEGWSLEMAIPFRSLPSLESGRPHPGDTWTFHVARYDYSVYLPDDGCEISSCAPLTQPFHQAEDWLILHFAP